jgi:hypothetical protein
VLGPYRDSDQWWWLGLRKQYLNNWTPWVHSSLLVASLLLDPRPQDIARTERAVAALDRPSSVQSSSRVAPLSFHTEVTASVSFCDVSPEVR